MSGRTLLLGAGLLAGLACGGGSGGTPRSTTPATQLAYQQSPGAGSSSWRLEQDPDPARSSATHVLLDLLAPTGTSGQGFTVVLTTDPGNALWSQVDGTSYAVQGLFAAPLVSIASVSGSGADLRIVFGQAPGAPVAYGTGPVLQVALDLAPGATLGDVTLAASEAGNLGASSPPELVTVSIGSLQAK